MDTAAASRRHSPAPGLGGRRRSGRGGVAPVRCSGSPAQEFAALASVFRRRLVVGASTAAAAAVGANFGGVTSFLLGLSPELGRSLRLDVLYPVGGFTRCLDSDNGFEFIYPANWVGDQTILYNQIKRAELQRFSTRTVPWCSHSDERHGNTTAEAGGTSSQQLVRSSMRRFSNCIELCFEPELLDAARRPVREQLHERPVVWRPRRRQLHMPVTVQEQVDAVVASDTKGVAPGEEEGIVRFSTLIIAHVHVVAYVATC